MTDPHAHVPTPCSPIRRGFAGGTWLLLLAASLTAQAQFKDLARAPLPTATNPTFKMAAGDVNGDGAVDIVLGNMGGSLPGTQNSLYLNDGHGRFTDVTATNLPQVANWTGSVALGDVDRDGDLDIFFGNRAGNSQLLLNDGTGKFKDASNQFTQPGKTLYAAKLVDIDFDTDLDLIMRGHISRNDGKGNFTDISATNSPDTTIAPWGMAVGDVDGDGDQDLMFGNTGTSSLRLWLNGALGKFTDASGNLPQQTLVVRGDFALGDVDGDGDLDAMIASNNQQNVLWLNDGKGKFTDATAGNLPVATGGEYELTMADIDGDGDLDGILFDGANGAAQSRLLLNDGKGKFTDATARFPVGSYRAVAGAVADFDLDGDLDIYVTNWNGQDHLWTNFHRQVDVATQPLVGGTLTLDYYSRPGYQVGSSIALNAIAVSLLKPRVQIPGLGSLGISPQFLRLPTVNITGSTGTGQLPIKLPNDPNLKNFAIYLQSVIIYTGPGARDDLTNVFAEVIR